MIERTLSTSAILEHATGNGLLVAITFVDLQNALALSLMVYINDTLKVPYPSEETYSRSLCTAEGYHQGQAVSDHVHISSESLLKTCDP